MSEPKLLPAKAAAEHIGISVYMLKTHGPKPVRIGERVYWRVSDLNEFVGNIEPEGISLEEIREAWSR